MELLEQLLRSPCCLALVEPVDVSVACTNCGEPYPIEAGIPVMLKRTGELKRRNQAGHGEP